MSNSNKEEIRQCKDCKYFSPKNQGTKGTCRKYAPQPSLRTGSTQWPSVEPDDNCWEFVQKFVKDTQISSTKEQTHKMGDDLSGPAYAFNKEPQEQ